MDIITVEMRNETSKAKQLRRAGIVPCVICGGELKESLSVQMEMAVANRLFKKNRQGSKVQIRLDEQVITAQIKEKTRDPMNGEINHISFQALKADQKASH